MNTKTFAALALVGALSACTADEERPAKDLTASEIADTVVDWWAGDYSNARQIAEFREEGIPIWIEGQGESSTSEQTLGGFLPVTSYYRTVDMPAFGDRVIYLEEFTFDDNPYRQRIYTVTPKEEDGSVAIKLYSFKDKTTYAGAWQDVSRFADVKPEDMRPLPDKCDLQVTQVESGRLEMKMPKNGCKFGSTIFDYQVSLSEDDFWYRDRIVNADTMRIKMSAGMFMYHKLDKLNEAND